MEFITIWVGYVWNMYCDSRSRITAKTKEELLEKIEDGQRRHLYGSILGIETERVMDWEKQKRGIQEWYRINSPSVSCRLPSPEDMLLIRAARLTKPEDWESIDPNLGYSQQTRDKLYRIRCAKCNEFLYSANTP